MLALIPLFFAGEADSATLYRGYVDPITQVRYMGVQDTTLDAAAPAETVGGATVLRCGNSNIILIQFRDLDSKLGLNREIVDARLVLTQVVGNAPDNVAVRELLVPWSEGPAQIVTFGRPPEIKVPNGAATYRTRRDLKPPVDWQQPGAQGAGDSSPVEGVTFRELPEARLEIAGLAASVQRAYDLPDQHFGFAIRMTGGLSEFFSSESPSGQPALLVTTREKVDGGPSVAVRSIRRLAMPNPPQPVSIKTVEQDGLTIPQLEFAPGGVVWPSKQSPITLEAVVENATASRIAGFEARWMVGDRWGSWISVNQALEPGATTTLRTDMSFPAWTAVPDEGAVRLQVRAVNAQSATHASTSYPFGMALAIDIEKGFVESWAKSQWGQKEPLTVALQRAVRYFNEVAAPRSRFGPFPNGCVARLNIEQIRIVEDKQGSQSKPVEADRATFADAHLVLDSELSLVGTPERFLAKQLLKGLGLVDWSDVPEPFAYADATSKPSRPTSAYGGLLGGDTRFEGMIPGGITIPAEPVENPIVDIASPRPSGLLSISDVAQLNRLTETRQIGGTDILSKVPPLSSLRCLDANGRPLAMADITIYGWAGSEWLATPLLTVKATDAGNVSLWNRKLGRETLKTPMGVVDPSGRNGWLLVEASRAGTKDYAWMSLPLLVEAQLRSPNLPALFDLRFNLSNAPVDVTNLASKRFVADSANGLPAALSQIVDGDMETAHTLPSANGAYIEIDLGRDRVIGEVRLFGDAWWQAYDIYVYATGQTVNEAVHWAKERDFGWTFRNRSKPEGKTRYVAHRASGQKIRYIRVVNRSESQKPCKAPEVQVYGLIERGG